MKRLLIVLVLAGAVAGGALAYFTSSGSGSASASAGTLSAPANVAAARSGAKIQVTWGASTIDGTIAATSYTVERYTDSGTDLGAATCSPVSSASGSPDAFGGFSCLDASGAGTFKYKVTAHYHTAWTATSGFTNSVTAASSATTLSSSANPSVSGQEVSYTATVTVSPAGTPTGNVEFFDGASPIAGCTAKSLSGTAPFQATCDPAYNASGGSHSITAQYLGDSNYPGSTSDALTQTVNKADTTTGVASDHNPSVTGQQVTYTATVAPVAPGAGTPGGTVTFKDGGVAIGTCTGVALSGGQATCPQTYNASGGNHSITVVYSGTGDFNGSSTAAALTQTVNTAATSTAVTADNNPAVTGQSVTYTATISVTAPGAGTPTGTVNFKDGGTTISGCGTQAVSGGKATCAVSGGYLASNGARTITAVYSGDTNFATSTSPGFTETVNKANTTTGVVSSVNPSVTGQQVTYTATVSASAPGSGTPGGSVTFKEGGVAIGLCTNVSLGGGQATCNQTYNASANAGTHSITVDYNGSGDYNTSSTAAALTQAVNKANTTTGVASSVNPSVSGQSVTYTATVAASAPGSGTPGGTVTFSDGGTAIAACTNVALASGQATCPQTYAGVGTHTITVAYGGSGDYNSSSTAAALTQTVNKAATTTGVASSANPSVTGQPVTYTATISVTAPGAGTPTGTVNFTDGGTTISGCGTRPISGGQATCVVSGGYLASGGSRTIAAAYSGDGNFNASTSSNLTQTVNKDATTSIVTSSSNPSVTGQQVTYTATVSANAPGGGIPGGTVTFQDGGVNIATCVNVSLASGQATCNQTYNASGGGHSVTVSYAGSGDYLTSTSTPALAQTVNKADTTTVVASGTNPSLTGNSVTFTATVTANSPGGGTPSGNVKFLDGGSNMGCNSQSLNGSGQATCSATFNSVSSHTITAQYVGNGDYNSSTSTAVTQIVNSSAVVGLGIVKTGGTGTPVVSCGTPSASYTCNVTGTGMAGNVVFTVTFVNSSGTATVYSTQSSTITESGNNTGSVTINGGASSSSPSTLTASHTGSSTKTSTLTFGSFTLTINVSS